MDNQIISKSNVAIAKLQYICRKSVSILHNCAFFIFYSLFSMFFCITMNITCLDIHIWQHNTLLPVQLLNCIGCRWMNKWYGPWPKNCQNHSGGCNQYLAFFSCVFRARESAYCPGTIHQRSWSSSRWLWATTSPLHKQMDFLTGSGPPARRLRTSVHFSSRYSRHCVCMCGRERRRKWQ